MLMLRTLRMAMFYAKTFDRKLRRGGRREKKNFSLQFDAYKLQIKDQQGIRRGRRRHSFCVLVFVRMLWAMGEREPQQ